MLIDPVDIVKFAFVAGEISPNYHARSDLEKFDLALSEVKNWFVDYRGGLSTRSGTEFIDYIERDDLAVILVPFKFASNIENTNMILFGENYIRIIQDGAYVLNDPFTITNCNQGTAATITAVGNDFAVGDWVKVYGVLGMDDHNGQLYIVASVGNTFSITDVYGNAINSSDFPVYISNGFVAKTVRVVSPYPASALSQLIAKQRRDLVRLTHPSYPTYNLTRNSSSSWEFELETRGSMVERPTNLTGVPPTASTFGTMYQVTAVDADGNESIPSNPLIVLTAQNPITVDQWTFTVSWDAAAEAVYYKVYRARIVSSANTVNAGMEVGYVGKTYGTSFVDQFITPNFAITPPKARDPFANGSVTSVTVVTPGDGYAVSAVLTATDPNPGAGGFVGLCVIDTLPTDATRPISGIIILDGGHDYTNPSFVVTGGGAGAGAAFTAQVSPLTGNYPALSAIFQQRQHYFATENNPLGIEASKPGKFSNFDQSDLVQQDDAYSYELDSEDASPILHALDTRGGLLLITASGIWQFSSGGTAAVTPSNATAEPQTYKGSTGLTPLKVDTSIIYAEYGAVKYLSYNDNVKLYSGTDISLLANHLFSFDNQMTSWAYADEPFKVINAVREDGVMLTLSLLRDQDVFAWTRYTTRGRFKYVASLQEGVISTVYTVVERIINGRVVKYLEKFANRIFEAAEDAWCLDAGLKLDTNYPTGNLLLSGVSGDIRAVSNVGLFTATSVGQTFRGGGGKGYIKEILAADEVIITLVTPITDLLEETAVPTPLPLLAGTWTLDTGITTLYGLGHLEGEVIKVNADGNVVENLTVVNKRVTLPEPVTRAIAGIGYTCFAKTLPPTFTQAPVEGKRKRPVGIIMRVKDSLALKIGTDLNRLYPAHERNDEYFGEPPTLQAGAKITGLDGDWTEDSPVYFIQEDPLPVTILGYVLKAEIGDDND
jgi:hypothetical protein